MFSATGGPVLRRRAKLECSPRSYRYLSHCPFLTTDVSHPPSPHLPIPSHPPDTVLNYSIFFGTVASDRSKGKRHQHRTCRRKAPATPTPLREDCGCATPTCCALTSVPSLFASSAREIRVCRHICAGEILRLYSKHEELCKSRFYTILNQTIVETICSQQVCSPIAPSDKIYE